MAGEVFSKLITSVNQDLMNSSSRNGVTIDRVVIHHNACTNKNVAMDTWKVYGGAGTSAHYEVTPTEIIGCVGEQYAAWHCGGTGGSDIPKMANPNQRSIGIENLNSTGAPSWQIAEETYKNLAKLVKDICKRYGIPCDRKHVLGHHEVTATACPGGIDVDRVVRMANGESGDGSSTPSKPSKPKNKKNVDVTYALHQLGKGWLDDVKNFNSDSNGFAGMPNKQHDFLYIKVSHGSVKYRVHTIKDGWLDWVTKGDKKDTVHGMAGIKGHAIDGVQIVFTTPKGESYQQAYYRSQTTKRTGWLGVCADNGSVKGFDSFAGMLGESLDRLQIDIDDHSKY
jgi:N-acetylmuramoyl-L-alanine amidase CwlA